MMSTPAHGSTSSARARHARTSRRRRARSARAGSRRPRRTTCGGSRTAGRRCRADRCEVILYTPEHDATFWSLGAEGARRVIDLWADRTAALGARDDVDVRARVREQRCRGRRDDHAPARPDLRIRLRSRTLPLRELRSAERRSASRGDARGRDRAGLARVGARGSDLPVRAVRLVPDDAVPDLPSLERRGPRRPRRPPGRRARAPRPAVRRADAVHALDPPAAVRRSRLAAGAAARRDRLAVARAASVPRLRRGRRARLGRLLQPGRARGTPPRSLRDAVCRRAGRRGDALDSLLFLGGRPSWELPSCRASASLQPGDPRAVPDAASSRRRSSPTRRRGSRPSTARWELPTRRRGPRRHRAALGRARGWREVRGPGPLDDAGLRPAPLHERRDALRRASAAACPSTTRRASTGGAFTLPRGWRRATCRPAVRRRRGGAVRARQRRAGRDRRRTPARRPSSTSPSSCATDGPERASSRSSSAGRTRASSKTRISGGTPGSSRDDLPLRRRTRGPSTTSSPGADMDGCAGRRDAGSGESGAAASTRAGGSCVDGPLERATDGEVRSPATLVGGGPGALHARRVDRRAARASPAAVGFRRRRDPRSPAARQREARADPRRQPPRPRRHPRAARSRAS